MEKIASTLRKAGLKATPDRLKLISLLNKVGNPVSARDIIEKIGKTVDQATVYRNLKILKEKGFIRQIDLRQNHAHYEIYRADEHHHLVCLSCGRIEDIHDCTVDDAAILKNSKHFSEIKQHALEFYGVCKSCQKKIKP